MLAHYIIAAKSALNSHQGFLNSRANPVLDRQGDAPDSVIEFETSVNERHLNNRAWVFQERIISSRIIHFTGQKIYWECGEFVRCNDWTSLECTPGRDYFAQDPAFPIRLHRAGVARATDFLQFVFAGYSRRGITVLTDRKKAISGILILMQKSFRDPGPYVVFKFGLHRLLLWYRSEPSTSRIIYLSQDQVPHWLWMAYPGEIKYLVGVNHKLNPVCAKDLYLDERGLKLTGKDRKFQRCQIGRDGSIYDGYVKVGSTAFDTIQDRSCDGAVVTARSGSSELKPDDFLFLLLVGKSGPGREYHRVGIAEVKRDYISRSENYVVIK